MKLDTGIVLTKGTAFVLAAVCLSLGTALAQWANSKEWPDPIVWVVILCNAAGQGANALISFLSGAYTDYVKGRANGKATGSSGADAAIASGRQHEPAPAEPAPAQPAAAKVISVIAFGLLLPIAIGYYSAHRSGGRQRVAQPTQAEQKEQNEKANHSIDTRSGYVAADGTAAERGGDGDSKH